MVSLDPVSYIYRGTHGATQDSVSVCGAAAELASGYSFAQFTSSWGSASLGDAVLGAGDVISTQDAAIADHINI